MSKFKVGDRVKIIDWGNSCTTNITASKEYNLNNYHYGKSWWWEGSDIQREIFPFEYCAVIREKIPCQGYAIEAPDGKQYIVLEKGLTRYPGIIPVDNPSSYVGITLSNENVSEIFSTAYNVVSNGYMSQSGGYEFYKPEVKKETNMSKITKFVKNLALSAEEKVLREVGFKDENGGWTEEAHDVLKEKMVNDNQAYLVDIAKLIVAENKTK